MLRGGGADMKKKKKITNVCIFHNVTSPVFYHSFVGGPRQDAIQLGLLYSIFGTGLNCEMPTMMIIYAAIYTFFTLWSLAFQLKFY